MNSSKTKTEKIKAQKRSRLPMYPGNETDRAAAASRAAPANSPASFMIKTNSIVLRGISGVCHCYP
jgi:hypothetical protein